MTADPLRISFVGAGAICEQRHLPGLAALSGVELLAVCNRSLDSSRRAQAKWGFARAVEDWRQVIEDPQADAVFIGTWPYLHCELSLAALAAGKHVFCQARIAMNWPEAQAMAQAAAAHPGQVAMVCPAPHRVRWERTVRQLLAEERFGALRSVTVQSTSRANADASRVHWREQAAFSGQNILQVGIFAETLNAWCGPYRWLAAATSIPLAEKIAADGRRTRIDVPQIVSLTGLLAGGAVASEFHSGLADGPERSEIRLAGSGGTCLVDLLAGQVVWQADGVAGEVVDAAGDPWQVEREFVEAVRRARRGEAWRVRPSFQEAAPYMHKLESIHESARAGRVVRLEGPASPAGL